MKTPEYKTYYMATHLLSSLIILIITISTRFKKEYREFSLTWLAATQMYWQKGKCLRKKRVQLPRIDPGHYMSAMSLF